MKNYFAAFILLLPLFLIFNDGQLTWNLAGLVYALVLYRIANTAKGKKFVNDLYEYTEYLTNKIYKL